MTTSTPLPPTAPLRRRHRRSSTAFFDPKIDEDGYDSSPLPAEVKQKSKRPRTTYPPPTIKTSRPSPTSNHILFALPLIVLLITYALFPSFGSHTPTPLFPLLTSLSNLTTLSPALPYTGLATHILMKNLTALPAVSPEVMTLAQQAKTLVEEFNGEEDLSNAGISEALEEFGAVEKWTEEGMMEGYVNFFGGVGGKVEGLYNRTRELGDVLGKLKEQMVGEEVESLGRVVQWVEIVFGSAEEKYRAVLEKTRKGGERMKGMGKGWMSKGLLKREVAEIEKYRVKEKLAGDILMGISKEYMEGTTEGAVEGKLERAIVEGRMDWW